MAVVIVKKFTNETIRVQGRAEKDLKSDQLIARRGARLRKRFSGELRYLPRLAGEGMDSC
jgi:hypothetical protein